MTLSRKALSMAYALIAALALIGTWGHNTAYLGLGFFSANRQFWQETLTNPASRSITVDLFFLALAVGIWMVLEARRLQMRGVWWYLVFGMLVAISVTVPLFLIHRQSALAARTPGAPAGQLRGADVVGIIVIAAGTLAYMVLSFLRPG